MEVERRSGLDRRSGRRGREGGADRSGADLPGGLVGGATYLGMHAPSWSAAFAAVVFHGGGHRPSADCPEHPLPAYFLAGDRNPFHVRVKDLRGWVEDCRQDIAWDLVRGGDHDREDRALDRRKALAILDWLAGRARDRSGAAITSDSARPP